MSRWLRAGYLTLLALSALALTVIHLHVRASFDLHAQHAGLIKVASDEEMLGILIVNQIGEMGPTQDHRLLGSISIPAARWDADQKTLREGLAPLCASSPSLCEHQESLAAKQRQLIEGLRAFNSDSTAVYAEAAAQLREQAYIYSVATNRWTQELTHRFQELVIAKQRAMNEWLVGLMILAIPAFIFMLEPAIKRFENESARAARLERASTRERVEAADRLAAERARAVLGEQRLRQITDNVPVWIATFDRDLRCQFANQAFVQHLRLERSVLGASLGELMGEAWLSTYRGEVEAALSGKASHFDEEYEDSAGNRKTISIEVLPEGDGGETTGFFLVGANITERKRIERTLTRQGALLSATSALAGVGSWRLSLSDDTAIWSNELLKICGLEPRDMPRGLSGFVSVFDTAVGADVLQTLRYVQADGMTRHFEVPFRDASGQPRWMRAVCSLSRVDGHHELLAAVEDVTDRHATEAALRTARDLAESANVAKSQFLANMSHEMRTPLNGVIGMITLLLDASLPAEQREFLEIARSSGESLLQIINDVLDLSKIEAGKLELEMLDTHLGELVEKAVDAVSLRAAEKNLEVVIDVPGGLAQVRTDPTRLRQVIINLLSNAVKFTEAGEITVTVAEERILDTHWLAISVCDSGVGMDEDMLQKLFTPFSQADASTTRRFGGTGLGLAISRRLVEALGGTIDASSRLGEGSTFKILLPSSAVPTMLARATGGVCWVATPFVSTAGMLARRAVENGLLTRHFPSLETFDGALRTLETEVPGARPQLLIVDQCFADEPRICEALREWAARLDARVVVLKNLTHVPSISAGGEGISSAGWMSLNKPLKPSQMVRLFARDAVASRTIASGLPAAGDSLAGRRVLLVDDNAINQKVGVRLLERMGIEVVQAYDGLQALDALAALAFDAVLMDCQMPKMDGYEATRQFRTWNDDRNRGIPIIALTADAFSEVRQRCMEAGMDCYLTKPVNADRLKATLIEQISRRAAAA